MMKKREGLVLWSGNSELDGKPVVLIATTGGKHSNRKTGRLIQTYILRSDIDPVKATQTGEDSSICGQCIHRKASLGSCYVRVETGVLQTFRAYQRCSYAVMANLSDGADKLAGEKVRLGAYGDPAAIPLRVWAVLLKGVDSVTGYTHQWKTADIGLAQYCMASCDTAEETTQARGSGWRTFSVVGSGLSSIDATIKAHAFLCPASKEAGNKLTCAECMACGGLSSSNKASVYIPVHGVAFKQSRFNNSLIQIGRPA